MIDVLARFRVRASDLQSTILFLAIMEARMRAFLAAEKRRKEENDRMATGVSPNETHANGEHASVGGECWHRVDHSVFRRRRCPLRPMPPTICYYQRANRARLPTCSRVMSNIRRRMVDVPTYPGDCFELWSPVVTSLN
jgi:hypothetical protein